MQETHSRRNRPVSTRLKRAVTMMSTAVAIGAFAGCASQDVVAPVAPTVQAADGLLGGVIGLVKNLLTPVTGLLRSTPLAVPVTRSITVDRNGGVLRVPETGLTVTIPRNAVSARVTITVTAVPGNVVAYEFAPHGLQFAVPLVFSQDLSGTGGNTSGLMGGYFKALDQLNLTTGRALVDEELAARIVGGAVQFDISHFSGYMVSTGRSSSRAAAPSDEMQ